MNTLGRHGACIASGATALGSPGYLVGTKTYLALRSGGREAAHLTSCSRVPARSLQALVVSIFHESPLGLVPLSW